MEKEIFPSSLRRLRSNPLIRSLVSPISFSHHSFILPVFVEEGISMARPIKDMESVSVQTTDTVFGYIESAINHGISKILLFPIPSVKKEIPDDFSFACKTIQNIKEKFGSSIWLASDLCLCSYTSHGHCGIMNAAYTEVLNHESVELLAKYASELANHGADCIAPSDMMDGRIKAIRTKLDQNKLCHTTIMAYSSKFSSQFYGPFRDACHSSPAGSSLKDRKSYQLSPFSAREALNAAIRDSEEGADILMVKPSGLYTDIIQSVKGTCKKPLAAYHVSGEYAAIEILGDRGILDRAKAHMEVWAALSRSGADIIISYAATEAKKWISEYEF